MDNRTIELIQAIKPITDQDPQIIFRGHAADMAEIKPIYVDEFMQIRKALEAFGTEDKLRFGFKKKRVQGPLFMVWREWWENGEVTFAKVLFNSVNWIKM